MFPCAFWSYTVWVQFACWNWLLERQPCFKFIFLWFTPRISLEGRCPFQPCLPCEYSELIQFSSVQSLSHVWLTATPWTAAHQASLSITISQSLLKLMSIELVMPSNHLILCHPLLLLSSIFPSIRVFSNESALCIRWPKYWSFSFNISPLYAPWFFVLSQQKFGMTDIKVPWRVTALGGQTVL